MAKGHWVLGVFEDKERARRIRNWFNQDGASEFLEALSTTRDIRQVSACRLEPRKEETWEQFNVNKIVDAAYARACDDILKIRQDLNEVIKE